jgi:hypothetical protein
MHQTTSANRRQIINNTFRYLTATVFGQTVGLVCAVLIPVLFSPTQLGVWNLMNAMAFSRLVPDDKKSPTDILTNDNPNND